MKKDDLILKLIKVCGEIDRRDIDPGDPEPDHAYEHVQIQAVRMLTITQLNKLLKEYEKKLWKKKQ